MHIPADHTDEVRQRVGRQAVERLGVDGARDWLGEGGDLPPDIVETILAMGASNASRELDTPA